MINLDNNKITENVRTIHLTAVCGTGMGALACMLKEMGYEVTGSDHKVYPPMSDFLLEKGIRIFDGFDGRHLEYRPDLVIIGNAVSKDNPEVIKVDEMGLAFCSMPQALNRFAAKDKKPVLITGTHGKTTTSSLMAWIIQEAGLDPTFMIGGILNNFNSNYRLGQGPYVVIEGDEYDTAFFDKGPKFLHYDPHVAILTSVEFDHADIFRDFDHVKQAFDKLLSGIKEHSTLIAYDNDPAVQELIQNRVCGIQTYGGKPDSSWCLDKVSITPPYSVFDVKKHGKIFGRFKTMLMGNHNLLNALAVIAAADSMGISKSNLQKALESFKNVKRRQEVRGVKNNITVMDDFAHHPTAVRETIAAVKPFYPEGRLVAVFEPRTNSSMRDIFQDIYPESFYMADLICIRRPPLLEKIPDGQRFSSEKLVSDLKQKGKEAFYFPDTDAIIAFLVKEARAGDVLLIMSNGGFDNIHARLIEAL